MLTRESIPRDLSFIEPYLSKEKGKYRVASWLKSPFEATSWNVELESRFVINWSVHLGGTSELLTSKKHAPLLESFKSWMILQGHPDLSGGRVFNESTIYDRLRYALAISDYILLHAARLGVDRHGLPALTENDLLAMLGTLASNRATVESVYEWRRRLTEFLRDRIAEAGTDQAAKETASLPLIREGIPPPEDRLTSLSSEEIILARSWLWNSGFYYPGTDGHKYVPNLRDIRREIYRDTLAGVSTKPSPSELWLGPGWSANRELPRVDVRSSSDQRMAVGYLRKYKSTLHSLGALKRHGLSVPDTRSLGRADILRRLDLKTEGRFTTLPQRVVLKELRHAIEFGLTYGREICDSLVQLAMAAKGAGETITVFANTRSIGAFLNPKLKLLGAGGWTIEPTYAGSAVMPGAPPALSQMEYYSRLRESPGLYELLQVLYGSVQIVVGTLMARRQAELLTLIAGKCLDSTRTRLIFECGKTGVLKMRHRKLRPIPPVGAKLIGILEEMLAKLTQVGLVSESQPLFAGPIARGDLIFLQRASEWSFNQSIDFFCDYFQVETDSKGRRYYIRQHQLRRFFAVLFFWGEGFGGLDVLRWFLGHSNVEHVYNYITENTPGAMLKGVKAEWAAEATKNGDMTAAALASVIEHHYGTTNFSVLDSEELSMFIETLLEDDRVTIEPEFLDEGRHYRILVKVNQPALTNVTA